MRPHSTLPARSLLGAAVAAAVLSGAAPRPAPATAPAELPWVVVDYSVRRGAYRVTGDVSLLSQRFSPGTSFDLIIAAVALQSGDLTEATEISCRTAGDSSRTAPLTLPRALKESNDDFFSQVLKRTGYEPVRKFLVTAAYTPGIPEAVASFADLARGEPLRVTVFEQNLLLQAFLRRELPLRAEHVAGLERWLALEIGKEAWGKAGTAEISPDPPRHVSWFNGAARMRDGPHAITVAVITPRHDLVAQDRFRRYVAGPGR